MRSTRSHYQSKHIELEKFKLQQSYEKAMGRIPSTRNYVDSHTSFAYSTYRPKKPYSVIPTAHEITNTQVNSPYKNSSSAKQYQFKLESPKKDASHQNNYHYTSRYISTNFDSPRKQSYFQNYESRSEFYKTITNQNTSPQKRNSEYSPSKLTYLALKYKPQSNENKTKQLPQSSQLSPSRKDISDFHSSPISNKYQSNYQPSPNSTKYQSNYQPSPNSAFNRFEASPINKFSTLSKHPTQFTSTSQEKLPSSSIRFTTTSESKVPTKITTDGLQYPSKSKIPPRAADDISTKQTTSSKNKIPPTTLTEPSQDKLPISSVQTTGPSKNKLPNSSAQSTSSSNNNYVPTTTPTQLPAPSENYIPPSSTQSTTEPKNKFSPSPSPPSQKPLSIQSKLPTSAQLNAASKNKTSATGYPAKPTETYQNKVPPSSTQSTTTSKNNLTPPPPELVEPSQNKIQQLPTQSEISKNKQQTSSSPSQLTSSTQSKLPATPTQVTQTTQVSTEKPPSSEAEKLPKTESTPESKSNKQNNDQSLNQNTDQVIEPLKSQKEFLDQVENSMKEDAKEDTNTILLERLKQYMINSKDDSHSNQSSPNKSVTSETNNSFESPSSFKSIDNSDNDKGTDIDIEISFDENESDFEDLVNNDDYDEDEFIRLSPIPKKTVRVNSYQFPKMLDLVCTQDFFIKPKVKFMIESTIALADQMTSDILRNLLDLK